MLAIELGMGSGEGEDIAAFMAQSDDTQLPISTNIYAARQ
jgi:hypothetical protein